MIRCAFPRASFQYAEYVVWLLVGYRRLPQFQWLQFSMTLAAESEAGLLYNREYVRILHHLGSSELVVRLPYMGIIGFDFVNFITVMCSSV